MQGDRGNAVWLGTHGVPGHTQQGLTMLTPADAMRLARAIRNLVKQELAAIDAANKEASTKMTDTRKCIFTQDYDNAKVSGDFGTDLGVYESADGHTLRFHDARGNMDGFIAREGVPRLIQALQEWVAK